MPDGYTGEILHVNLTNGEFTIEEPSEDFYRKYLGGPGIGLYYLLQEQTAQIDPLSPDNTMIFAPGLLTGTQCPCVPRFTVCSKSPLTDALGKSEAGGYWGPQLKRAGFDALVIKGKASEPVYLWINNGQVELRKASHIWGKGTGETQDIIRNELNNQRVQIAQIGPAGENMVRFAGITNDLSHFNGRNGLGAVMGSKNLKAIAVWGTNQIKVCSSEKVKEIFQWLAQEAKVHPLSSALHEHGTPLGVTGTNAGGSLPTNNWQYGVFDQAQQIGSESLATYLVEKGGCYACPIRCKRVVEIDEPDLQVDRRYGGPEYETLVALGSNCGISNLKLICKANELCNQLGMDTISAGMAISFAMECFENNLINEDETDGLELRFGKEDVILKILEQIAYRKGFGKVLADGTKRASEKIGDASKAYCLEVKGQEVPMHDPRVKTGVGLQYAISFNGADHWFAQHDAFFTSKDSFGSQAFRALSINEPVETTELSPQKVKLMLYSAYLTSLYDLLGACVFGFVARSVITLDKVEEMVKAVTGWDTSLWELMKVGERAHTMGKMYNLQCGLGPQDDRLPSKFFEPIKGGPLDGEKAINQKGFEEMISIYYEMAGWDKTGKPISSKLIELGLE